MDELLTGGYRLYTAMNTKVQLRCAEVFEDETMFPANDCQAALVLVNAKTGYIEAIMGGRDNDVALAYNRATEIRRQPGSVIKPILVYAPALESYGFTASSMLLDTPTDFNGYMPKNYGDRYNGWVTLREAVMKSLNVPAVKVLSTIGVNTGITFAEKLGLEFDERDKSLALALGGFTYGVSPFQVASAFACFAAGGTYEKPTPIISIMDAKGNVLYRHTPNRLKVMSEQNAFILTSMLQSAIEEDEGTGRRLGGIGIPLAGKTGTVDAQQSNGNRDAWMAAYNPEYAAAVWMGYDNSEGENALPKQATGGTYPALILKEIFIKLYEGKQAPDFVMPQGVKRIRLDGYTLEEEHEAVLATALTPEQNVVTEVFVEGTEPKTMSGYWVVPSPPMDVRCDFTAESMPRISFTPPDSFAAYRLYRRDEEGNNIIMYEFEGIAPATYVDNTAKFGKSYEYYVIPYHPDILIGGRAITGPASRSVKVVMPEYMFSN
jgi:membrane peptidoglycan carboxypeptidase